jgi:hypothetical protein
LGSCAIYKLAQGGKFLICSELFAIGRSIIAFVFQKIVRAINVVFKRLKMWHAGDKMQVVMTKFKNWCGTRIVVGAIDDTHIAITNPSGAFVKDDYYHKTKGYTVVAQAMVVSQKIFTNVYVGLHGSVNDS